MDAHDLCRLADEIVDHAEANGIAVIGQRLAARLAEVIEEELNEKERRDLPTLIWYTSHWRHERRLARSGAQRRARRLLLTYLTAEERQRVKRSQCFLVLVGEHRYRISSRTGTVQLVRRAGRTWRATRGYCYHDPTHSLPGADEALGNLLMLLADEAGFLEVANESIYEGDASTFVCQIAA